MLHHSFLLCKRSHFDDDGVNHVFDQVSLAESDKGLRGCDGCVPAPTGKMSIRGSNIRCNKYVVVKGTVADRSEGANHGRRR